MTFYAATEIERERRRLDVSRRKFIALVAATTCCAAGMGRAFGTSVDFIYSGVKAIVLECQIDGDPEVVSLIEEGRLREGGTSFISSSLRSHRPDIAVAHLPRHGARNWPEGFTDRTTLQAFAQLTVRASEDPKGFMGSTGLRLSRAGIVRGITWYPTEPFFSAADKVRLNEAASKALNLQLDYAIVQVYLKNPNI